MKNNKHKYQLYLGGVAILIMLFAVFYVCSSLSIFAQELPLNTQPTTTDEITKLNQELQEKRDKIKQVEEKKKEIEQQLNLLQRQTYSIQNQVTAVNSQIENTEYEIEKKVFEIDKSRLEIEKLATQIHAEEVTIDDFRNKLSTLIQVIDAQDRTPALYVLLTRENFSSFISDVQSAADIQVKVSQMLSSIKDAKAQLEVQKQEQQTIQTTLQQDMDSLERNRETLDQQKSYQLTVLEESKKQAVPFKDLLDEINKEEDYANSQIQSLENVVRERLLLLNKGLISNKNVPLSWPVILLDLNTRNCASYVVCSALFYDQDYYGIFGRQHTAIDIPVPQGTPVYAPADGYVVGVVYGSTGAGVGSLSIVKIDHTDDQGVVTQLSTKYLHLSKIVVAYNSDKPQFVKKGDLIGYSGGLPGTMGSGTRAQSTGPHLHFEVLSGGIPVNPLQYLP